MYGDTTQPHVTPPLTPRQRGIWAWFRRQKLAARIILVIGAMFFSTCACCSAFTIWGATLPPVVQSSAFTAPTATHTHKSAGHCHAHTSKANGDPELYTNKDAFGNTDRDPKPKPTATPTPKPTSPPARTGVNGNPWGCDFNPGAVIYSPNPGFCSYFACIASFSNGQGYVVECSDSTYSKSGGQQGSCSKHEGG